VFEICKFVTISYSAFFGATLCPGILFWAFGLSEITIFAVEGLFFIVFGFGDSLLRSFD
jgi:hypothetical protein